MLGGSPCLGDSFSLNSTPGPDGSSLQHGPSATSVTQECPDQRGLALKAWTHFGDPMLFPLSKAGWRTQKVSLVPHCPVPPAGLTVNGQIIGDKGGNSDPKTRKTYFGKLGIASAHMDFRMEVTPEKVTLWNGAAQSTFSWLDTVTISQDG